MSEALTSPFSLCEHSRNGVILAVDYQPGTKFTPNTHLESCISGRA